MKTLQFKAWIDCTPEELWEVLWSDETYPEWTAVFSEGSHAVSEWKLGGDIQFLGPNGDGIYGIIQQMVAPKKMTFVHQGEMKEGKKLPPSDWSGSKEAYTLQSDVVGTALTVNLDTTEAFAEYFQDMFPKALQKLKDIAELTYEHEFITVRIEAKGTVAKAWEVFTHPDYIMEWNHAGPDWHCPTATNDLRIGGKFVYRMEPKRGKDGFDFTGTYTEIEKHKLIQYELGDGRKVIVRFVQDANIVHVIESFHPENEFPKVFQRGGWQSILENMSKSIAN